MNALITEKRHTLLLKEIIGEKPRIMSKEEAAWLAGVIYGKGYLELGNTIGR